MAPRLQYHNVMVGPDPTICSRMARDPRVEPEGDEDRMKAAGAIRRPFSWVSVTLGSGPDPCPLRRFPLPLGRSEEHTSELQSLMRISYAVFCLKKKTNKKSTQSRIT